jgi:lactate permease
MFVVPFREIKRNILFVYLSILSCIIPYLITAYFSYEFPTLIGGITGFFISVLLAKNGIGLFKRDVGSRLHEKIVPMKTLIKYSFPLWGSIIALIITRIQQFGFYDLLTSTKPWLSIQLGNLCHLNVSQSLIITADKIFNTSISDSLQLLFIPSLFPFLLFALLSIIILKMNKKLIGMTFYESIHQIKLPIITLMSALVFVDFLMVDGERACTRIIGHALANLTGAHWNVFASFLGAIGAFFSGSNTVSNLMFGGIQMSIANQLHLNQTAILALQSVGGAFGTMTCINSIIAVCVVLGINKAEGYIIKRTCIPLLVYGIIAAILALFIT